MKKFFIPLGVFVILLAMGILVYLSDTDPLIQPEVAIEGFPVDEMPFGLVRVFFGTDRKINNSPELTDRFLAERGQFSYGTSTVSIPRDHRMGELEAPSILKFEWREDPQKHVVLLDVIHLPEVKFFSQLQDRINDSPKLEALVFIHGYNVSFEDAARRTAQMSYDLAFEGASIFYSWPSQGTLSGYLVDETNVEWTQSHLKKFLVDLATRTKAKAINIIAHSMGNRALTKAFSSLVKDEPHLVSVFREIILTAPDMDADVFKNDIAPQLIDASGGVTLYASGKDKALSASKKFHGYRRAGDIGDIPIVLQGMDTIDATQVSTDLLGHSYFAEHNSVLSDIFYLIRGIEVNQRHGLRPAQTPQGKYWVFQSQ